MSNAAKTELPDVAILTRAVENVFRKLVRLLLGKISLKKLQEMMQVIFVEEAEARLQRDKPGKNIPMSTLAVMTGFDTRMLTKIRARDNYMRPFHQAKRFLREITPECSVLDVWESSSRYRDSETLKPMALPLKGPSPSFESLVNEASSTRGVTAKSFLQRLQESQSVVVDGSGETVRMIDKRYTPFGFRYQTENVRIGMAAVGNLVDTIAHNLSASPESGESFYQRGCWSNRLRTQDVPKLRKLIRDFLLETDQKARSIIRPFEQEMVDGEQLTAGISVFYFEEHPITDMPGHDQ